MRSDSRFKTLKEVMDDLRDKPNGLTVGGFSSAGFHQFVFFRLQQEGKLQIGLDSVQGRPGSRHWRCSVATSTSHLTPSSALAQIQNGDIRLLGISSEAPHQYFPDVPTFKEQGYDVVERHLARRHGQGRHAAHR